MKDLTVLSELPVFTRGGTFVGHVKNTILDLENRRVEGLILTKTNPDLVEGSRDVAIPYRWVADYDRIMVLNYFPESVHAPSAPDSVEDSADAEPDDTEVVEVTA